MFCFVFFQTYFKFTIFWNLKQHVACLKIHVARLSWRKKQRMTRSCHALNFGKAGSMGDGEHVASHSGRRLVISTRPDQGNHIHEGLEWCFANSSPEWALPSSLCGWALKHNADHWLELKASSKLRCPISYVTLSKLYHVPNHQSPHL